MSEDNAAKASNFIRDIINEDLANNKNDGKVVTRFPPEPNGYLHIGHAKAICLSFGIAKDYNGVCHLRMDDTNPEKESMEFAESIIEDVKWLGWDWQDKLFYASDYYEKLYDAAVELIKRGKAYVCHLTADEVKEYRGNIHQPGRISPYANRSVEENLDLFARMRAGEFAEGECTLRARVDMSSPNLHMRDPAIYRIRKQYHYRTADKWCIYPMYDYAHCMEDSFEGITHSLCTLEFEIHRPIYDWFLDALDATAHPQQIEFARLNLTYTVMSKRILQQLVEGNHVDSWDDPRMPTISGFRRRGYTPESIINFCETIGITKFNSMTDIALLEHCIREDLNTKAPRVMGVLDPIKVIIDNYPDNQTEQMTAKNHPSDSEMGTRNIPFSKEIYIERDDFREVPPRKYHRLYLGNEVRLRYGYLITCTKVIKDNDGNIKELHCTYDPESRGGNAPDGRKVKGTIHWVSAKDAVPAEIRLYDRLFTVQNPLDCEDGKTFIDYLNPNSLQKITAQLEPSLANLKKGVTVQFERKGYFCLDKDATADKLVFNRTVAMRDSWAKIEKNRQQKR